ncbi:hypothetical protein [Mesorhizobium sp. J8]|uniref:hypothetical protein n=1 Tax=Mesorhizobium sp. J8 TaxID=2777475 RepID=UPI001916C9F4|nr:hypothetical protein [Mesorhizobium sp. J8]BCM20892.1 hypothetical protein MJ8_46830 [Mesorhizobium sp. J8]
MSAEDILLWGAVLVLGFIAGAAIYFESASFRESERLSASHSASRRSPAESAENKSLQRGAKGKPS